MYAGATGRNVVFLIRLFLPILRIMAMTLLPEHTCRPSFGMCVYDDEAFKAGDRGHGKRSRV